VSPEKKAKITECAILYLIQLPWRCVEATRYNAKATKAKALGGKANAFDTMARAEAKHFGPIKPRPRPSPNVNGCHRILFIDM